MSEYGSTDFGELSRVELAEVLTRFSSTKPIRNGGGFYLQMERYTPSHRRKRRFDDRKHRPTPPTTTAFTPPARRAGRIESRSLLKLTH